MEASPTRPAISPPDVVFCPDAGEAPALTLLDRSLRAANEAAGRPVELAFASGRSVVLPDSVAKVLAVVVREMAAGNGVAVVPVQHELTTHQAAALLHVSRPHLIRMLDEGRLPYRRVGTHRRVRLDDVLAHRAREEAEREVLLTRLAQDSQALGLEF